MEKVAGWLHTDTGLEPGLVAAAPGDDHPPEDATFDVRAGNISQSVSSIHARQHSRSTPATWTPPRSADSVSLVNAAEAAPAGEDESSQQNATRARIGEASIGHDVPKNPSSGCSADASGAIREASTESQPQLAASEFQERVDIMFVVGAAGAAPVASGRKSALPCRSRDEGCR